jgi:hypothetical protein
MGLFSPRRPRSGAATATAKPAATGAPRGGDAPAGGGGYRRSRFEEMSLARFIQTLPEVVEEIGTARKRTTAYITETAQSVRNRAAAAADGQPVNQNVAAELFNIARQMNQVEQEAAERMRRLEERAAALKPMANQRHESDRARWEAPRKGSHAVEEKADNRAARNDT